MSTRGYCTGWTQPIAQHLGYKAQFPHQAAHSRCGNPHFVKDLGGFPARTKASIGIIEPSKAST